MGSRREILMTMWRVACGVWRWAYGQDDTCRSCYLPQDLARSAIQVDLYRWTTPSRVLVPAHLFLALKQDTNLQELGS